MKMEQTECSETSAYKFQTPGNHPKESIQHQVTLLKSTSVTWRHFFNYPYKNLRLSLWLITYHGAQLTGERRFSPLPSWGKWPVSCSGRFTGGGRTLDIWTDGVGPEPVWIHWNRQQLCPWLKLNPQPSRYWIRRTTALIITRILFLGNVAFKNSGIMFIWTVEL